jgi:hypothetical protein
MTCRQHEFNAPLQPDIGGSESFLPQQSPFLFHAPIDVECYRSSSPILIAPSSVRRSRLQTSGEDGQAALSAAAFLKLDEIE